MVTEEQNEEMIGEIEGERAFVVETKENDIYTRRYKVIAKSLKEAEQKYKDGNFEDCIDSECEYTDGIEVTDVREGER